MGTIAFGELLYDTPSIAVIAAVFGIQILVGLLGRRFGLRARETDAVEEQAGILQSAILGLLALLLGFTFSMAMSRFDARKAAIVQEANAIGTAYLRARMLPEAEAKDTDRALRALVDSWLEAYNADFKSATAKREVERQSALHDEIWAAAIRATARDPRSIPFGLFADAANHMIDLHEETLAALGNHVPELTLWLLIAVSIIAVGFVGYASGAAGQRSAQSLVLLAGVLSAVMFTILDIDRPRRGIIRARPASMQRLQTTMRADERIMYHRER